MMSGSGVFLLLSVLGSLIPSLQTVSTLRLLTVPGAFLYRSFSVMAFYPVLYLLYNGLLIARNEDSVDGFFISSFLFLPMLSLSIFIRFFFDSSFPQTVIGTWLIHAFTASGAMVISATASLALLLLLFRRDLNLSQPEEEQPGDKQPEVPLLPSKTASDELIIPESIETSDIPSPSSPSFQSIRADDTWKSPEFDNAHTTSGSVHSFLQTTMSSFTPQHNETTEPQETELQETEFQDDVDDGNIGADYNFKSAPMFAHEEEEFKELEDEIITLNFRKEYEEHIHHQAESGDVQTGDVQALVDIVPEDFIPMDHLPDSNPTDNSPSEDTVNGEEQDIDPEAELNGFDSNTDDDFPVNEDMLPHLEPGQEHTNPPL